MGGYFKRGTIHNFYTNLFGYLLVCGVYVFWLIPFLSVFFKFCRKDLDSLNLSSRCGASRSE